VTFAMRTVVNATSAINIGDTVSGVIDHAGADQIAYVHAGDGERGCTSTRCLTRPDSTGR